MRLAVLPSGRVPQVLSASLEAFAAHVRHEARAVWMWAPGADASIERVALPVLARAEALEAAAAALLTLKYENGQDAHESRIAPGLPACPGAQGPEWDRSRGAHRRRNRRARPATAEGLYAPLLHYRQAIRRLVVLRQSPEHIGTPDYVSFS